MRNVGKAEFMSLFQRCRRISLQQKLQMYSLNPDPQLRNLINEFNTQCQQRAQWLSSTLSEAGGTPYITS